MRRIPEVFSGQTSPCEFAERKPAPPRGDLVCFGDSEGNVYSYEPDARKTEKITKAGGGIGHMAEVDGVLYFSDAGGKLHFYDFNTRKEGQVAEFGEPVSCMAVAGKSLYFGIGCEMYAYSPVTGKQKRVVKSSAAVNCVAGLDGKLYFGNSEGKLHCYTPFNGKRKKAVRAKGEIECITASDGLVYFAENRKGNTSNIRSYEPATGELGGFFGLLKGESSTGVYINWVAVCDSTVYCGSGEAVYGHRRDACGTYLCTIVNDDEVNCAVDFYGLYFGAGNRLFYHRQGDSCEKEQVAETEGRITCAAVVRNKRLA